MQIKQKDVYKILITFLFAHLIIWTLIPSISNINLPLDTIEALAWGSDLDWGFNKHPPASAFFVEVFYQIFGSQDCAYYFLSQIFVVSAFFVIFKLSEDFFQNRIHSLISILLLEGIYFYNFTTPEFNVNVCQLPFWALTVYYCWNGIKQNDSINWLLFGLFAAIGVLSKYIFVYLLAAIVVFFIYLLIGKKNNFKSLIYSIIFLDQKPAFAGFFYILRETNEVIKIMIEMTFELAEKIAKAAHKKSEELNRPMSVSIVDESGRMVYYSRADGAGFYTFDTSKAKKLGVGGFIVMAKEVKHFAFTREEGSTIQLHGIGPWGITYVNPADDPRQKSPSE